MANETNTPTSHAAALKQRERDRAIRDLESAGYVVIAPGSGERDALVRVLDTSDTVDDWRALEGLYDKLTRPVRREVA